MREKLYYFSLYGVVYEMRGLADDDEDDDDDDDE